jgi:hypothetical protein
MGKYVFIFNVQCVLTLATHDCSLEVLPETTPTERKALFHIYGWWKLALKELKDGRKCKFFPKIRSMSLYSGTDSK